MHDNVTQKLYSDKLIMYSLMNIGENTCNGNTIETDSNPLCGDKITVWIKPADFKDIFTLERLCCQGEGCALLKASMNYMLFEFGQKHVTPFTDDYFSEIYKVIKEVLDPTAGELDEYHPAKPFEGVRLFPTRSKCVLLPWQVADTVIKREKKLWLTNLKSKEQPLKTR